LETGTGSETRIKVLRAGVGGDEQRMDASTDGGGGDGGLWEWDFGGDDGYAG
jgi:hypothetical protein